MCLCSYLIGDASYSLFDNGLANLLGLETLKHGTNPLNYISIRLNGADPNHGGKITGSSTGLVPTDRIANYFHVFKDSEYEHDVVPNTATQFENFMHKILLTNSTIGVPIYRSVHKYYSCWNAFSFRESEFSKVINRVVAIALFIFSPSLSFRFAKIDKVRMENDPDYEGCAYRTKQVVENWRIGILGTLITGVNLEAFSRIKAKPLKFLLGVVQITAAIALVTFSMAILTANPMAAVIGVVLS